MLIGFSPYSTLMTFAVALIDDRRVNAVLSWLLVAFLLFAAVESTVDGELLWAGLAAVATAIVLLPAALLRDPTTMPAWIVVLLATVPLVGRSLGVLTEIATYLAVASLALLVAVEIDAFSSAEMTPPFAVAFVVVTTMSIAGVWTIAQFASDRVLATSFIEGQTALMWNLVLATAVGLCGGLLFELYFRRYPDTKSPLDEGDGGESA